MILSATMQSLADRLRAGGRAYRVEVVSEDGFVLICVEEHAEEFARLVRNLIDDHTHELVVLPASDGSVGYTRAVILTL